MFETQNLADEKSDTVSVSQKTTIFPLQNMILSFYSMNRVKSSLLALTTIIGTSIRVQI